MREINEKYAAIIPIFESLAVLTAKNDTYERGRHIWCEDEAGRVGHKIGRWDWKNQAKEAAPKFNDLPWQTDPESSGSGKLNMFAVRNTDEVEPKYEYIDGDSVITDSRLKGKTDYFVAATTVGREFWDTEVSYDPVNGKFTLTDFELKDDEKIRVIIPQGISADPDFISLETRLTTLENLSEWLLAPLIANGGEMIWNKPFNQIPEGWEPVPDIAGRTPKACNDTGSNIGQTGGNDTLKLKEQHIPEMNPANGEYKYLVSVTGTGTAANVDTSVSPGQKEPNLLNVEEIKPVGTPEGTQLSINLNDPYRIVAFIRPIAGYIS